ncbi:MAG: phenylalanine--tRNA ligase subunit alpha, partial [Candidatus Eremiobacteraeota bacterium]|nr:phenylalanine--tRNA ligase subunit alpha [Candidatus Eremiobacteraeota bacterium]
MADLTEPLERLERQFVAEADAATDERQLDAVRVRYLGRQGEVTQLRRTVGTLPPERRRDAGKAINDVVAAMERHLEDASAALRARAFDTDLAHAIDVTFPAPAPRLGSIHPVRHIIELICDYFMRRGFAVVLGPEAEPEYYNFDALNIPGDHPARENFDSFWLSDSV